MCSTMDDELYTVEQVAEKLSFTRQTVWKYIRDRKIPSVVIGKNIRVRKSDLNNFIENAIQK